MSMLGEDPTYEWDFPDSLQTGYVDDTSTSYRHTFFPEAAAQTSSDFNDVLREHQPEFALGPVLTPTTDQPNIPSETSPPYSASQIDSLAANAPENTLRHAGSTSRRGFPAADHSEDWLDPSAANSDYEPNNRMVAAFVGHASSFGPGGSGVEVDVDDFLTEDEDDDMAPTTRHMNRSSGHGSTIDLTMPHSAPASTTALPPRQAKRPAEPSSAFSQAKPPGKRTKHLPEPAAQVEHLDLTSGAPSAEEELAQSAGAAGTQAQPTDRLKIGQQQCIICMEPFTNATIAHCGHIYCHECLTHALRAGEKNSERGVGSCPVCRKVVSRSKSNHIIPLSFMKKSWFDEKKKAAAAKRGTAAQQGAG